jgi:hypothetical protein
MASNRSELVETLALHGVVGSAMLGELDALFAGSTPPTAATTSALGVVKQSAAVANLGAQTVTDITTAQTAINAIVAKINAILAAERTSGQLAT